MPEERKHKQGKKNRKNGRNRFGEDRCGPANRRYVQSNRRFYNKLRRVERCNGEAAARVYQARWITAQHTTKSLVKVKGQPKKRI